MTRLRAIDRLIIHQHDPDVPVAGGISTCIRDMLDGFEPGAEVAILGVTQSSSLALGTSVPRVTKSSRTYQFMPVVRMSTTSRGRIPQSLRLAAGLLRYRAKVGSVRMIQIHRVEYAPIVKFLFPRTPIAQLIHGEGRSGLRVGSDSLFRRLPWLYMTCEAIALRLASVVVVFSKDGAERLKRRSRQKVSPFMTWYDETTFGAVGPGPLPPTGDLQVAWVGRLEAVKDPLLACETLRHLREGAQLSMVGEGSLRDVLRQTSSRELADGSLLLSGELAREEVARVFKSHHVSLMTSHFEGSPRALIESLACGCPVVCTAAADPDGLITNGVNGFRVKGRDPVQLAGAVEAAAQLSRRKCAESVAGLDASTAVRRLVAMTSVAEGPGANKRGGQ